MKTRYIRILVATIITLTSISMGGRVFAYDEFYSSNDILFYASQDSGCLTSPSSAPVTSPISSENQKTTAKFLAVTNFSGNSDKPMNAIQIAAIMGNLQIESGFNPNASNNDKYMGIVQWSNPDRWGGVAEPKTDLSSQLSFIKTELDGNYKDSISDFWSASVPADLEKATYAITRNYEGAVNTSKTNVPLNWTNNTDAVDNLQSWQKRIDSARGFYNQFGNLAGSGYTPGSGCGELVSGGMTLETAKSFMNEYKSLEPKNWANGTVGTAYEINGTDCYESSLANCVAFSQYFINRYTTKKATGLPNGKDVVDRLLALGFVKGDHIPKVYAVFSKDDGSDYGHTGVVLGIDTTSDKVIIGEAGCGDKLGLKWIDAREYKLSEFSSDKYTYAYTDGFLKEGAL